MSGIVGSRLNIRGSGLVGSLGTDGQVFTSSGAGAGAAFEDAAGGGAFVLLGKDASNTSATSYSFDTFDNGTYKGYLVVVDLWTSNSDGTGIYLRVRNASGDITGSNYYGCHYGRTFASGSTSVKEEKVWGASTSATVGWGVADSADNLVDFPSESFIWFTNITSDSMPMYHWQTQSWDGESAKRDVTGTGVYKAKEDIRGFTLYSSGTHSLGTVSTYGITNA